MLLSDLSSSFVAAPRLGPIPPSLSESHIAGQGYCPPHFLHLSPKHWPCWEIGELGRAEESESSTLIKPYNLGQSRSQRKPVRWCVCAGPRPLAFQTRQLLQIRLKTSQGVGPTFGRPQDASAMWSAQEPGSLAPPISPPGTFASLSLSCSVCSRVTV